MDAWYKSEAYEQLREAVRARDIPRQARIIEETIASLNGPEKAFWVMVRHGFKLSADAYPRDLAWLDLDEALAIAPEDFHIRESVLFSALGMAVITEDLSRLYPFLRQLRGTMRHMKDGTYVWYNLGMLHLKRCRCRAALKNLSRAVTGMLGSSIHREIFRGRLYPLYCRRALAFIRCRRLEEARQDLAEAEQVASTLRPEIVNHMFLAFSRSELALREGNPGSARATLQAGVARQSQNGERRMYPDIQVEAELMAARIARAEGNQRSFQHFCQRALTMAQQYRLPLSELQVQSVMRRSD